MAGKFFNNLFGLGEDDPASSYSAATPTPSPATPSRTPNKVVSIAGSRPAANQPTKIELVAPRIYGDGRVIIDQLLAGHAVIVNFNQMDPKVACRIVEYIKGAAYAIKGKLERIDAEIFLCTPPNVEISGKLTASLRDGRAYQGESL